MSSESNRPAFLTPTTWVPLGSALLVMGGGFASYYSLKDEIRTGGNAAQMGIVALDAKVTALSVRVDARTEDIIKKGDLRLWALQLQQVLAPVLPPGTHVPMPE